MRSNNVSGGKTGRSREEGLSAGAWSGDGGRGDHFPCSDGGWDDGSVDTGLNAGDA
eukprot:CAMPEP_0119329374 /NCGR_PEP_ID=MMETSP1333-20130426/75671_1 /TAXON_ID=418940 /ORGANISM="Scyphosphaera apsteinii, Strain RCC1455" /LENGTH=55 /DNA_ID=CAMNT_0007338477 /DNA_START=57 /DNA_END=221 /DNA_ORIENTATION=+